MNKQPPARCRCGAASKIKKGGQGHTQQVLLPGMAPKHCSPRAAVLCADVPLPYVFRTRGCLQCGREWSTVELRLEDISVALWLKNPPEGA